MKNKCFFCTNYNHFIRAGLIECKLKGTIDLLEIKRWGCNDFYEHKQI